jgi:hypothetical protein
MEVDMVLKVSQSQLDRAQVIIRAVVDLQRELFELGFVQASARMAAVNDKLGWEMAERMEASDLVGKEEQKRQTRHATFDERESRLRRPL